MAFEEKFFQEILDHLTDGVYFVDQERRILYWNKGAERITGYQREQVIGKRCMDNILMHMDETGRQLCLCGCALLATFDDGQAHEANAFLQHRDGHRVPIVVRAAPITDEHGRIIGAVETFSDNSKTQQMTENLAHLEKLAFQDQLTGLANRRYLEINLQSRFDEFQRYGWPFGVIFIDIDNFKTINDRHGHDVGDQVLRMVGRTLGLNTRTFDFIGRWGGEEFIAIITNIQSPELLEIAERFRILVEHSQTGDENPIRVTISSGAALVRSDDDLDSLIRRADEMLYRAKASGRNRVCSEVESEK